MLPGIIPGLGHTGYVAPRAVITGMKTWGANNSGYANNVGRTITLVLKGSNTDPTTTGWTGTTIGTIGPFSNIWATDAKQTLGNANATRYRWVWCEQNISAADYALMCEVEFYETLFGVETAINSASFTKITNAFVNNLTAFADGNTNQSGANSTNVLSVVSVAQCGLDLGA